jgi:uncharacterized membrane protein
MSTATDRFAHSRLVAPATGVLIGVALCVASWVGGYPDQGVAMLAVMGVFAVVLLLAGRRSETVAGVLDHRDERLSRIDLQATAVAGQVLTVAVIVAFIVELARGNSGTPFTWLGAIFGVTYLFALAVLRWRG